MGKNLEVGGLTSEDSASYTPPPKAHDIGEHKKAEQALGRTRSDLAHLSRVLTVGELTSSIAHEVNQPLAAVVTYGQACLEWLAGDPPDLEEARQAAERIIRDATRASAVLDHTRALFMKGSSRGVRSI